MNTMKKILFVVLALVILQKWNAINAFFNPPPDFGAMHDEDVILYATEWCGYCQKARNLMDQHSISYFEYDIEKSEEGRKQHKALGGSGIPVLLIKGQVIKGYSPNQILALAEKS